MEQLLENLFVPDSPVIERIVRPLLIYTGLLIGLRLVGKREMGEMNPADLLVLLLLTEVVSNALGAEDYSVTGGLIGAAVLYAINNLIIRLTFHSRKSRRAIEGTPEDLMKDGHVVEDTMRRNHITREELASNARLQGIDSLAEVRRARLEVSGDVTFMKKEEFEPAELVKKLFERLDAIERKIGAAS